VTAAATLSRRRFLVATAGMAVSLPGLARAAGAPPASAGGIEDRSTPIRVLLRRAGASLDAATARVSSEGPLVARELGGDRGETSVGAGEVVTIGADGGRLWLQIGDGKRRGPLVGPLQVASPEAASPVYHHAEGAARPVPYRGLLEAANSERDGKIILVNVLGVDEYLAGVVPVEMPASFGAEPSRAQAVAARSFALARKLHGTHRAVGTDVCDSLDCQSYGGLAAEQALSSSAVEASRDVVLLRDGTVLEPFYHSACGGHTEAQARLFGSSGATPESDAQVAVPDGEVPAQTDLASDAGAAAFYRGSWDSHCAGSSRYRWRVTWERRQLENVLNAGLRRLAGSPLVEPAPSADVAVGVLDQLVAAERGDSGRVLALRIEASNGSWTVRRDWTIRNLLRAGDGDGQVLASSAFALERTSGGDGKLGTLTALGGGWGHGVGMCQWGARGLAVKGLAWEAILAHYYPGARLGTAPR
jgi:stage II sporulation protein D